MLRFHTQTGGSTLTAQQPDVNVVRVTLQALSAVLGGTQSLHTNARDEALGLPTEESAQLALRTQQVIAFESGVAQVPDPLGGSEYIESLTDQLESDARSYLDRIDNLGGTLVAIEKGFIQSEIQNSAYEYQRSVEEDRQIVVGVNKFQSEDQVECKPFRVDPALEYQQIERVRAVRAYRSAGDTAAALNKLERAAQGSENLLPRIFECCKCLVTVGEISDCLRRIFGEYRDIA
jgi:methylmalonyl-CoA mutase N-terminal domain/subunit